ncbi:MAG TPA: hypothetical protein VI138_01580 [Candidatus Dormibacteraeota bacterium]
MKAEPAEPVDHPSSQTPSSGSLEEGGDPACWQRRVCPDCGSLADTDPPTKCLACGAAIPG